ncbi:hypothetical protein D3C78_1473470 [compost metagenome]
MTDSISPNHVFAVGAPHQDAVTRPSARSAQPSALSEARQLQLRSSGNTRCSHLRRWNHRHGDDHLRSEPLSNFCHLGPQLFQVFCIQAEADLDVGEGIRLIPERLDFQFGEGNLDVLGFLLDVGGLRCDSL